MWNANPTLGIQKWRKASNTWNHPLETCCFCFGVGPNWRFHSWAMALSCLFVETEVQHPRYLWKQETISSDFGCYLHSVVLNYFDNRWMLLTVWMFVYCSEINERQTKPNFWQRFKDSDKTISWFYPPEVEHVPSQKAKDRLPVPSFFGGGELSNVWGV